MPTKGASLLPQDFAVGGAVPDGDYTMTSVSTSLFDYGGKSKGGSTPALTVVFTDGEGNEITQHYSAGKTEFLIPSDDGKRFVHPAGGDAKISKSSNCAMFISSLLVGGFPTDGLTDDVSAFAGHRVQIENIAQPKRPGLEGDDKEKTIPLVKKYLGEAKGRAVRGAASPRATTQTPKTAASTASSTTHSNGSDSAGIEAKAIATVQSILGEATDNATTVGKLGTTVMLRLTKLKDPDVAAVKKLMNGEWLQAHADTGGWVSDGETVILNVQ